MNTSTAPCPACNAPIALTVNAPQCVNNPTASVIILTHEKGFDCTACGAYFVLAIAQCDLDFALVAAERPIDAGLIIPTTKNGLHIV
jgi:hypothetical protein